MRNYLIILILAVAATTASCGGEQKTATPLDTFKTYVKAIKKKDTTTVKILLSAETLKAHDQEAKAQGVTVDDIVKRDSFSWETQKSVEYKNEKVDGEKATLEVKDSANRWQTFYFIRENGEWKIDMKGSADQLLKDIEEQNRQADEQFNLDRPLNDLMPAEPITPSSNVNANAPIRQ